MPARAGADVTKALHGDFYSLVTTTAAAREAVEVTEPKTGYSSSPHEGNSSTCPGLCSFAGLGTF